MDRTLNEIATFYNSATDDEKLVLEEAARSVGRIPTKRQDGSLAWTPLLAPDTINENIIARAMHVTVANVAAAEVKEVFGA